VDNALKQFRIKFSNFKIKSDEFYALFGKKIDKTKSELI
jgi:hypothetical protein